MRDNKTKRQQRTVGSIVEIKLNKKLTCFARILKAGYAFYNFFSKSADVDIHEITSKKILFILEVYNHAVTKGRWKKIGKLPLEDDLLSSHMQFIQDSIDNSKFSLYDPNTGEITPATREECEGLERAAVWEPEHVEERLLAYYDGRPSKWVESLKIRDD